MGFPVYACILGTVSLVTMAAFAIDKRNSASEQRGRIPEIVLLTLIGMGGAVGGLAGMYLLRHKTNFVTKFHFAITVWLALACQLVLGGVILGAAM